MADDELSDYEKHREARYAERQRKEQRARFALAVYRDLCITDERHRMPRDRPTDYPALATEAVEAADALLAALEPSVPQAPLYSDGTVVREYALLQPVGPDDSGRR